MPIRPLTERAKQLRTPLTDAERYLWQRLRRRQVGGYFFRRQCPLGPYIVDFVCFQAKVVVELDGGQHQQQAGYDQARDDWLRSQGFRVLRFWNNEVFTQTEGVLEVILRALEPARSPAPPP